MVESIMEHCKNEVGFASLKNVLTFEKMNSMESFFFGETLKYAYLIFARESAFDFKKTVMTTEAHPFKIEKAK
ncbi:MAG: glycoside hydrolase family 47 protein [Chitinophagaceae bacterium]|nr:glycoside hydrolase family 47 protein [Chitinophagaceae bacterium]